MKPLLLARDLKRGHRFRSLVISLGDAEVNAYRSVVPNATDDGHVPPGVAAYLSRLAYLQDNEMPPGGVLRALTVAWFKPIQVGAPLEVRAEVIDIGEHRGRARVQLRSTALQHGATVFQVDIDALWGDE